MRKTTDTTSSSSSRTIGDAGRIVEPPQPGLQRPQHHEAQDQHRLHRRHHLQESLEQQLPAGRLAQGSEPGQEQHDQHDAQDHAQIAEVRQGVLVHVLVYTLHGCNARSAAAAAARAPSSSEQRSGAQAVPAPPGLPNRSRASHIRCKTTPPKTWSGRFSEPVDELVKHYTASVGFDQRLAEFDIQGSLAHARMLQAVGVLSAQDLADIERGMAQIRDEIRAGRFAVVARSRGRASQHREAAHRSGRRGRQAAAHRPLAQRPGRHRRAAVAARRDRRDRPAAARVAAQAGRPRRAARRYRDARVHPSAGCAAGELRPSPAGLLRDAPARPRPAGRLPPARQPVAAGRCSSCRHHLSHRPGDGGARARLRRRVRQLAGRGVRSRLRDRVLRRRGAAS